MYIDPTTAGMSLQAWAVLLAVVTSILFVLSRQVRPRFARVRVQKRSLKHER